MNLSELESLRLSAEQGSFNVWRMLTSPIYGLVAFLLLILAVSSASQAVVNQTVDFALETETLLSELQLKPLDTTTVQGQVAGSTTEMVIWSKLQNAEFKDGILSSKSVCNCGTEDARAGSSKAFYGDTSFEYTIPVVSNNTMVGVDKSGSLVSGAEMDFSFWHLLNGTTEIRENGIYKTSITYKAGDVFTIEMTNSSIKYFKNESLIIKSETEYTFPMYANASMQYQDGRVSGATFFKLYDLSLEPFGGTTTTTELLVQEEIPTAEALVVTNTKPIGYVDGFKPEGVVFGWAKDSDVPDTAVQLHFYVDTRAGSGKVPAFTGLANLSRSDVGQHAFEVLIPAKYRDGRRHNLYTYAIDVNDASGVSNVLLPAKTRRFRISPSTTVPTAPIISSFTASPANITTGQTSVLAWNVSGATSLTLDQGVGNVSGATSTSVTPTTTTTYTLTASNSAGSVSSLTTVTVGVDETPTTPPPAPTVVRDGYGDTLSLTNFSGWFYDSNGQDTQAVITYVNTQDSTKTYVQNATRSITRTDAASYLTSTYGTGLTVTQPLGFAVNPSSVVTLPGTYKIQSVKLNVSGTAITLSSNASSTFTVVSTTTPVPTSGNLVTWTALKNMTVSGSTVTKTSGSNDGVYDASAVSTQKCQSGDCYVEFTATEANDGIWVGFSTDTTNSTTSPNSINNSLHFFYYSGGGFFETYAMESGIYKGEKYPTPPGAVLRLAIESGKIKYYHNGSVFYTSAATPIYPLVVKVATHKLGIGVSNVTLGGVYQQSADTSAPVLSGGAPSGTLPAGTTSTTLSVTTNELAACKYGTTANTAYNSLPSSLVAGSSNVHTASITGLSNGVSRTYYIRCADSVGNQNSTDYPISFSVSQANTTTVRDGYGDTLSLTKFDGWFYDSTGTDTQAVVTYVNTSDATKTYTQYATRTVTRTDAASYLTSTYGTGLTITQPLGFSINPSSVVTVPGSYKVESVKLNVSGKSISLSSAASGTFTVAGSTTTPGGTVLANQVTVSPTTQLQNITGWEATAQAWQLSEQGTASQYATNDNPAFAQYKNALFDHMVNELGITRLRIEMHSGVENPTDYFSQYLNKQLTFSQYFSKAYEVINDNSNATSANLAGFKFASIDHQIDKILLPVKSRVEAKGDKFHFNLCYVDFGTSAFEHYNDPNEYAELMLAFFQHSQSKYGFVPDTIELVLEPDNTPWNGTRLGQAMQATQSRLQTAGFSPKFILPSVTNIANANTYFDQARSVVGDSFISNYVAEFAYHRYGGASSSQLTSVASKAAQFGIGTSHLELIGANIDNLFDDVGIGNNSAWSQYTIAWPTSDGSDDGGKYYLIDGNNQIVIGSRTMSLSQVMKYVRPGARRVGTTSNQGGLKTLGFTNQNGTAVVVVKNNIGSTSFSVLGLSGGTYGITYVRDGQSTRTTLADVTIIAGQPVNITMPGGGVATVYKK